MGFQFKNKTVYIISPERWGTMKVSKHHYALELAEMGCKVFFIEPPSLAVKGILIKKCDDHPLISIVNYKPIFRAKRFLPSFVFSILVRLQICFLVKKIALKPDVVWSFQGFLFENLRSFGAPVNIFFAADQFSNSTLPPEINSADITLAVSDTIYEKIKRSGRPVFQINHGLIRSFALAAEGNLKNDFYKKGTEKIIAGYVGNLRMQAMDTKIMMQVIEDNLDVDFIFWGSYKNSDLNLGGISDIVANDFISFLEKQNNVFLRGPLNSTHLQEQMKEANLFWFCYDTELNAMWDGSNSHKILEYLSTGCPVVSHYVSFYKGTNLLTMLHSKSNVGYLELFGKTVDLVKKGEDKNNVQKRLAFVLENTYDAKIKTIELLITF